MHTCGPWNFTIKVDMTDGAECAVWGPDGDQVAKVWGNLGLDGDAEDTAALIAAAPELLHRLGSACTVLQYLSDGGKINSKAKRQELSELLVKIRSAIAKAEKRK